MRGGEGHLPWNLPTYRGKTGDLGQDLEGVLHRPVSFGVTEDVAFSDTPLFGGEDVADGDVAGMERLR